MLAGSSKVVHVMAERSKGKEQVYDVAVMGSGWAADSRLCIRPLRTTGLPLLERGEFYPGSERLGTPAQSLGKGRYKANETWLDGWAMSSIMR